MGSRLNTVSHAPSTRRVAMLRWKSRTWWTSK